ncbi:MAG: PAS domain-containing protein [Bacteroidales bacterium]|nr:PAS domain-containing protein [Bacteroidales bacterium]
MNSWQLTPVFPVYLLAILIAFLVAVLGWRMRPARGATYFSLMSVGISIWSLGYLLGFFNTDLEWKLVMVRVEYLGGMLAVYFWLPFVISFIQNERWLSKRTMLLLAIMPVITYVQILLLKQHGFFYQSYHLTELNGLIRFSKVYNIGFYMWVLYTYLNLIIGSVMLLWGIFYRPKLFRMQNFLIVLLVVIILLPNALYVAGLKPLGPYDPTPLTFVLAGIISLILLWRYKLFDIVPIAHHLVFKNVRIGVFIIDNKMRILEMNPASENILGKTQNEIMGATVSEVLPDLNDFLAEQSKKAEMKSELIIEPGKRIFEIQKTPLVNSSNKTIGNIVMLYEITELKQTLDELNAFAHSVAHDLKSPLAGQWTRIELLKNSDLSGDEMMKAYQDISQAAEKMMSIVDALLLLSDVRSRKNVPCRPLNMGEVIDNVLERMDNFITEYNAKIILPQQWPEALGYAPWIEEVWVNYINNGVKYGGKPPVVEVGADQQEKDRIRFWVKDNGEGLGQEEMDSLFKEFLRLERHAQNTSGHGLGLSIVSRIMNKLGGEVGVNSDGKTGCTFYFTLKKE